MKTEPTVGKHFPLTPDGLDGSPGDAVTVSPGHLRGAVIVDEDGSETQAPDVPTVTITVNQGKPSRVALTHLSAGVAREVAAELVAQADAIESAKPVTLPEIPAHESHGDHEHHDQP